ncbi:MAG: purine-nucleoside phosphorylase [Acidobacteria bacterium]|nr:purine-nucleoside phosphorylase [Acidobacteriota bacterium]
MLGAADAIERRIGITPSVALVLGSGLGAVADSLDEATRIPYEEIPGWPSSTVEGHAGQLVVGQSDGQAVAVMQGRVHLYEGYSPWEVTLPVRVLAKLGCRALILTNAAGGINPEFAPGDLMMLSDHLNLQGSNPCAGPNLEEFGERFFDMTAPYDARLRELAHEVASTQGVALHEGIYAALLGPSFETAAEVRMLAGLGADAVGMSTAPETIAARHAGLRVAAISCVTNLAAGLSPDPLDHEEVMEVGARVRSTMTGLLTGLVSAVAAEVDDAS